MSLVLFVFYNTCQQVDKHSTDSLVCRSPVPRVSVKQSTSVPVQLLINNRAVRAIGVRVDLLLPSRSFHSGFHTLVVSRATTLHQSSSRNRNNGGPIRKQLKRLDEYISTTRTGSRLEEVEKKLRQLGYHNRNKQFSTINEAESQDGRQRERVDDRPASGIEKDSC